MKNLIALVFTALVAGLSACSSDAVLAERAELARQDSVAAAEKQLADSLADALAYAAEKAQMDSLALIEQTAQGAVVKFARN